MRILVLDYQASLIERNTISEHLYSFKKYSDHEFLYVNVYYWVPPLIQYIPFDMIIYHYTFLSRKWDGENWFRPVVKKIEKLKRLKAYSIALPQDEYVHSELLCKFFKDFRVHTVYTCLEESEWEKVYPKAKCGVQQFNTVLTGYVDEKALEKITPFYVPHSKRSLDLGYRARRLPYWLGSHGTIKWRLTEVFQRKAKTAGLKSDLSNDENDVFWGDEWYKFLANCRVVLGCEGGSSIHDPDGSLREKVNEYVNRNPAATFDEVEKLLFPGVDGNLKLFAISPRHFEAAMTRTCQVLVEGSYFGIFEANKHYIELKKDFSNLDEVLWKIKDAKLCEEIAQRAYEDIILSGKYTYRSFVQDIFVSAEKYVQCQNTFLPAEFWSEVIKGVGFLSKVYIKIYIKIGALRYRVKWAVINRLRKFVLFFMNVGNTTGTRSMIYSFLKATGLHSYYKLVKEKCQIK